MNDSPFDQLKWLGKNENPFGFVCLDCRSFTHAMLSCTQDPLIAKRFSELRLVTGEEYRWTHPSNAVIGSCSLKYPAIRSPNDGPLFKATVMEEKWDIYRYEGVLYFSRSWTGDLVFTANMKINNEALNLYSIEADAEVASKDTLFIVQQVDFLIKSHIFHKLAPHPLPPDLPNDIRTIALYSFSQYGSRASFATYEDTIAVSL